MFDMHYDLLSLIYKSNLDKDNKYVDNFIKNFNESNIKGAIFNLYFMDIDEMSKELGIDFHKEKINVVEMFKQSVNLYNSYNLNINSIFSIEGCDYIEDEQELEKLYNLGLRNIVPVWNHESKYGGGTYSDIGLTEKGKALLNKAIDLGIVIDFSHANNKTFFNMIDVIKENISLGKEVISIASHSNSYSLKHHPRNLSDEQLEALKEINAVVGVVSYKPFICEKDEDFKNKYLEHINHIVKIMGINNVGLSTDNMEFASHWDNTVWDSNISNNNIYNYDNIKEEVENTLKKVYNKEEIEKLMYKNIEDKILSKLERKEDI